MIEINKFVIKFTNKEDLLTKAACLFNTKVYNLIVTKDKDKHKLTFNVCSIDTYNDILIDDNLINTIINKCTENKNNFVQYWEQPKDISKILKLYKPFIINFAKIVYDKWSNYIEYEDILQDIYLTMIELHNKNYFLNKYIIKKSYLNKLYMKFRPLHKGKYNVISYEKELNKDEDIKLYDILPDTEFEILQSKKEQSAFNKSVLQNIDILVLKYVSERNWEQCKKAYITQTTGSNIQTIKTMQRVRHLLKQFNINLETFLKGE